VNRKLRSAVLTAFVGLLLASCAHDDEETAEAPTVAGAASGVEWSWQIAHDPINVRRLRPSALLGTYTAQYIIQLSTFGSALDGIQAYVDLRGDTEANRDEDFALLETLGAALQTDIPDMLNRSPVRATAFDAYVGSLADVMRRANARLERLEQELETINDDRRTRRQEAGVIQRELNAALREDKYALASEIQQRLLAAEIALSEIEAKEDTQRSLIRLYEKLLTLGERRLVSMHENREILIAGLKVIELPGIDALGILEQGDTRALRRDGGPYEFLFDGL